METTIITAEIICIIVMSILMLGSVLGSGSGDTPTRYFRAALGTVLAGTVVDIFSLLFPSILILNMFTYLFPVAAMLLFAFYMVAVIRRKAEVPRWVMIPAAGLLAVDIVVIGIGFLSKKIAYYENGEMQYGPWEDYPSIFAFLCILYLLYLLFCYRRALSSGENWAIGVFLVFPIVDAWVTTLTYADFTYPIISIGFLTVYVIVQEHHGQKEEPGPMRPSPDIEDKQQTE